jgi:phospholipid/cholesterol/gamma-HCH transport system substrate-binding protein
MFKEEKLELKVGLFIGAGIFIMFFIMIAVKDFSFMGQYYNISSVFDYVNGVTVSAPVRLAGVRIGEVDKVDLYFDEGSQKTKVLIVMKIKEGVKIKTDAVARINTLGLLGEQYMEITPGQSDTFLQNNDDMPGHNPTNVGEQIERMNMLFLSMSDIMQKIKDGDGTMGKLVNDDTLYVNLSSITGKIDSGEGTVGKFLTEDKIYNDVESFVEDLKKHPWKLLHKPREKKSATRDN